MFDPIFDAAARALAGIYGLPVIGGSYGIALFFFTLVVMFLLMPLTLKATRSTIKMQLVQPQLKEIQKKYDKSQREEMNAELMALYQREGINPVGGCVPMLAQAPIFFVMFRLVRGLTRRNSEVGYYEMAIEARQKLTLPQLNPDFLSPNYLEKTSEMYQDLATSDHMNFGPLDLALHANEVLRDSVLTFIPYLILIILVVAGSFYQQRQVTARRPKGEELTGVAAQQQQLLKILPAMTGIWSFFFPAGLVLYWAYQSIFRIAQQAYITKSLYGDDGLGTQAMRQKPSETDEGKAKGPSKAKTAAEGNKAPKKKDTPEPSATTEQSESADAKPGRDDFFKKKRAAAEGQRKASEYQSTRLTPKGTKPNKTNQKKRKR